jgi:lipopolysaccharide/colanic/teichoic acid biosynthesis glycosyltransferase
MLKRAFDIAASIAALLLLTPLLLPIMLALRLTGEGEVFYRQERVGRYGQPFSIYKFATMLKDSPILAGGDITVDGDPRVLPLGRFLRKTKINELPQLLNVLRGDMSIIGPRPLTKRVAALFPQCHWANVAELRPGLSGIGSIVFCNEEALLRGVPDREQIYAEHIMPYKLKLEDWYARNQSLTLDAMLMVLTIAVVVFPGFNIVTCLKTLPRAPEALRVLQRKASLPSVSQ